MLLSVVWKSTEERERKKVMAELKEGFDLATLIIPQHSFTLFIIGSTPPTT